MESRVRIPSFKVALRHEAQYASVSNNVQSVHKSNRWSWWYSTVNYLLLHISPHKQTVNTKKLGPVWVTRWQHNNFVVITMMKYVLTNSNPVGATQYQVKKRAHNARGMPSYAETSQFMQMYIPGFHLCIEVILNASAFIWPEFILHPLTYVSTDWSFIQRPLLQTMRKQDTLCLLFCPVSSVLFKCLKDCQSQESLLWINTMSPLEQFLVVHLITVRKTLYRSNVTPSFKMLWENPGPFALHPDHFAQMSFLWSGALADTELLVSACCLLLM